MTYAISFPTTTFNPEQFGLRKADYIERASMAAIGIDPVEHNGEYYFLDEEFEVLRTSDAMVVKDNVEYYEF